MASSLAEYALMAMSYYAKDVVRLNRQKKNHLWEKYDVEELRGATLGIIGYGDIGSAIARLATAYGMNIVAFRANKNKPIDDEGGRIQISKVYGNDELNQCLAECDYIAVALALTPQTQGILGKE